MKNIAAGLLAATILAAPAYALRSDVPPYMPDPVTTPGDINPDVTPDTIKKTICNPNWSTKLIRPPASYTDKLKRQQLAGPEYQDKNLRAYEEDHLISLEIGGHPTSPRNLWPEPYDPWKGPACGAHVKDQIENEMHKLICAGKLDLHEAQHEIATDWVKAYNDHIGPLRCGS